MSAGQAKNLAKNISRMTVQKMSRLLLNAEAGREGTITGIHTQNADTLKKIMAMGVLPGMPVKVIRKSPSVVFKVGNTILAVDKNIAQCIEIEG